MIAFNKLWFTEKPLSFGVKACDHTYQRHHTRSSTDLWTFTSFARTAGPKKRSILLPVACSASNAHAVCIKLFRGPKNGAVTICLTEQQTTGLFPPPSQTSTIISATLLTYKHVKNETSWKLTGICWNLLLEHSRRAQALRLNTLLQDSRVVFVWTRASSLRIRWASNRQAWCSVYVCCRCDLLQDGSSHGWIRDITWPRDFIRKIRFNFLLDCIRKNPFYIAIIKLAPVWVRQQRSIPRVAALFTWLGVCVKAKVLRAEEKLSHQWRYPL